MWYQLSQEEVSLLLGALYGYREGLKTCYQPDPEFFGQADVVREICKVNALMSRLYDEGRSSI